MTTERALRVYFNTTKAEHVSFQINVSVLLLGYVYVRSSPIILLLLLPYRNMSTLAREYM